MRHYWLYRQTERRPDFNTKAKATAEANMNDVFSAFVRYLRAERDWLRAELETYESGAVRIGTRSPGGPWQDITKERIAEINGEIASIEATIASVTAQHDAGATERYRLRND